MAQSASAQIPTTWEEMVRTHTKSVVVVVDVVIVTDRTARIDRSALPPEGGTLIIHGKN